MHILIACDKFKGSLSAVEVAHHLRESLQAIFPDATYDICPIADGGEGTTEAIVGSLGAHWQEVKVSDAQNRPVQARYALITDTLQAVMEMSAASGLHQVSDLPLQPSKATTLGTGRMMAHAATQGARSILLGIGGSATNDGGLGVAIALGYQFLSGGKVFEPSLETFLKVEQILPPPTPWALPVVVACDVDIPLLGPLGCTRIYGPQKGVKDFDWFEKRLEHLARLARRDLGIDAQAIPGAGAAGGLGFGLMVFAGARLVPGFELIAEAMHLDQRIQKANIVFTGEGRLDAQSLQGKGPVGVARLCKKYQKPVVGVSGSMDSSLELKNTFDLLIATKPEAMELAEAIACTPLLIRKALLQNSQSLALLIKP